MATRYFITADGSTYGSQKLPVTGDVKYFSAPMGGNSGRVDCYVEFYNFNDEPATPTAGTIYFSGRPMGRVWLSAMGSPINAVDAGYPDAGYTPPYMYGSVLGVSVRFSGVTGADYACVVIYKGDPA